MDPANGMPWNNVGSLMQNNYHGVYSVFFYRRCLQVRNSTFSADHESFRARIRTSTVTRTWNTCLTSQNVPMPPILVIKWTILRLTRPRGSGNKQFIGFPPFSYISMVYYVQPRIARVCYLFSSATYWRLRYHYCYHTVYQIGIPPQVGSSEILLSKKN